MRSRLLIPLFLVGLALYPQSVSSAARADEPPISLSQSPLKMAQGGVGDSLLTLPPEVKGPAASFIVVRATTNCTHVRWFPVDVGLSVLPQEFSKDSKATVVMAGKPGRYRLLAYTAVGDVPSEPSIVIVIVGDAPDPGPGPGPGPNPPDPPAPTTQLRVILVFESSANMTKGQMAALYSQKVEDYLTAKCVGGKAGWRRFDKDVDVTHVSEEWKRYWTGAKPNIKQVPAVVILDGEKGNVYAMPDSEAALLELLKKAGG